ncbi:MAG TPA: methyl-accepting chemotaxis protein [Polyangiaceae bacterium]|nr:methyl-accepting chemotaxis protein [Polyangiaceae bacterium]
MRKSAARRQFAGQTAAKADLIKADAQLSVMFKALEQIDARLTTALKTGPREMRERNRQSSSPDALRASWDQLTKLSDAKTSEDAHVRFVADIRALMTHVGDSSKLILDPDLDTYYAMDAFLLKGPDIIDRASQMGDEVDSILNRKTATIEERENLAGEVALLRAAADGLKADVEASVNETVNFNRNNQLKGTAMPQLLIVTSDIDALLGLTIERIIRRDTPSISPAEYAKAVQSAVSSNGRLFRILLDEQDKMLETRMKGDIFRRTTALGTAALAVLFSMLLGWLVLRTVTQPIAQVVDVANRIARGEVPETMDWQETHDEMGLLLGGIKSMLKFLDLRNTIQTLQQSAVMLTEALKEMDQHSNEAEQQITRQAAALHETQATAQEIKQTSQLAAQKAEVVLRVAEQADTLGRSGESAIEHSLGGLSDIRSQFQEVARCIKELSDRTMQIGSITQTVKDLADQSNMLALNAAIEAVRSGEHGKGFAVVAREIRSLADQSIQATNRVQEILESTSQAIRTAVTITETGGQRMEGGLLQVKESGENLHELSKIVKESSQGVRQIAAAVSQQNAGITQIFTAVIDQNKMMEETAQRLTATRQAAQLVKGACQQVADVSSRFHL